MRVKSELKYMLSKEKRSCLMLVKIKNKNTTFTFPIILFIFEDILDSFYDLLSFFRKVIKVSQHQPHPADLCDLFRKALLEMRGIGQWELADIETAETKISIKFF